MELPLVEVFKTTNGKHDSDSPVPNTVETTDTRNTIREERLGICDEPSSFIIEHPIVVSEVP